MEGQAGQGRHDWGPCIAFLRESVNVQTEQSALPRCAASIRPLDLPKIMLESGHFDRAKVGVLM